MTKCQKCGEVIYKSEIEEHNEEEHSSDTCGFCGLEMKLDRLMQHVVTCGSRSSQCGFCGANVLVMDFQSHVEMCQKLFEAGEVASGGGGSGFGDQNLGDIKAEELRHNGAHRVIQDNSGVVNGCKASLASMVIFFGFWFYIEYQGVLPTTNG